MRAASPPMLVCTTLRTVRPGALPSVPASAPTGAAVQVAIHEGPEAAGSTGLRAAAWVSAGGSGADQPESSVVAKATAAASVAVPATRAMSRAYPWRLGMCGGSPCDDRAGPMMRQAVGNSTCGPGVGEVGTMRTSRGRGVRGRVERMERTGSGEQGQDGDAVRKDTAQGPQGPERSALPAGARGAAFGAIRAGAEVGCGCGCGGGRGPAGLVRVHRRRRGEAARRTAHETHG